jgi:hypothetical protein
MVKPVPAECSVNRFTISASSTCPQNIYSVTRPFDRIVPIDEDIVSSVGIIEFTLYVADRKPGKLTRSTREAILPEVRAALADARRPKRVREPRQTTAQQIDWLHRLATCTAKLGADAARPAPFFRFMPQLCAGPVRP